MSDTVKTLIAFEDYLIHEEKTFIKSEYRKGEIVAFSGVTPKHDLIVNNLTVLLYKCLKKKGCNLFSKDVLLYVPDCDSTYYPDIFIICGKIQQMKRKRGALALLNPSVIIEVLSEGTADFDRGEKFDCCKSLSTLQQYVLVEQDKIQLENRMKLNEKQWLNTILDQENDVLNVLGCEISLQEIYEDIHPEIESIN